MPGLSEILANTNERVSALESSDLDDNATIAGIRKLYGNIKITCTVSVRTRTNLTPSSSLYPATDLYDEIYPIG